MAGAVTGTPAVLLFAFLGFPAIARPVVIPVAVLAELALLLSIYFVGVRPVAQVVARGRVDTLIGTASWLTVGSTLASSAFRS